MYTRLYKKIFAVDSAILSMAKKRTVPQKISPYVWGYLVALENTGVPITSAYVFGSWAKGKAHRWSDVDLCIVSPKFTSWSKTTKALAKARTNDLLLIEPHGFHPKTFQPKNDPLAHEVVTHGIKVI